MTREEIDKLLGGSCDIKAYTAIESAIEHDDLNELLSCICHFYSATKKIEESIALLELVSAKQNCTKNSIKSFVQQVIANSQTIDKAHAFALLAVYDDNCSISSFNAGYFYKAAHQYELSLKWYQESLDRNISQPQEVLLNLATLYADHLQQPEKAIALLNQALDISPNYSDAIKNLANLYEQQGEQRRASSLLSKASELDPYDYSLLARIVETQKYTSVESSPLAKIKRLLAMQGLPLEAVVDLNYAAAKVYNDCQRFNDAFEHYQAANRANKQLSGDYQREQVIAFNNRCIKGFPVNTTNNRGSKSISPVFIVGMFRSGSTLAEQILAAHSQVAAAGELPYINEIVNKLGKDYPNTIGQLGTGSLEEYAAYYHQRLADSKLIGGGGDRLITDKRPDNFLHIGLIKTLFPEAKIIHTQRNPIDNCWSIYNLRLANDLTYANDLDDIMDYYKHYQELMAYWQNTYSDSIFSLNYDELVSEPESVIKPLLSFLDLNWEDECLNFYKVKNQVKTASIYQVRQPLYQSSSGRWRHYKEHLQGLFKAFG